MKTQYQEEFIEREGHLYLPTYNKVNKNKNQLSEKEIKKILPLTISSKTIKYFKVFFN